jgi:hypothetical protein
VIVRLYSQSEIRDRIISICRETPRRNLLLHGNSNTPPRSVNNNLLFNSNCYYFYVYFTFIDSLFKAIGKTVTRHSLTMATQRAAEKSLGAAIFIPPKAIEEDYGLFQALSVEGKNGRAEFNTIHCGITEKFIKKKMPAKIQELEQLLASAETAAPNEFAESIQLFEAKNGSLGSKIQSLFLAKVEVESSSDSGHELAMTDMKRKLILSDAAIEAFLEGCLPAFCGDSSEIRSIFKQTPTLFSGDIEFGLAFVTTNIVGSIHVQEDGAFHCPRVEGQVCQTPLPLTS